jgi:hypothetical protein
VENVNVEHRYIFLVRLKYGEEPALDSYYELKSPAMDKDQANIMTTLDPEYFKDEIAEDAQTFSAMTFRIRANMDIFQHVCLIRTTSEVSRDDLQVYLVSKHNTGELLEFLDESAVR